MIQGTLLTETLARLREEELRRLPAPPVTAAPPIGRLLAISIPVPIGP